VEFLEDDEFRDPSKEDLLPRVPTGYLHSFVFVADREAISNSEFPILVVDLLHERGRVFRAIPPAGSGSGSPYISHEWPADSLRFAAIHFRIASCASFMRLYGPR
jgi:hypothetical protein